MTDSTTLTAITSILAQAGREIILPAFHASVQSSFKADGSIVTETDVASQQFTRHALNKLDIFNRTRLTY